MVSKSGNDMWHALMQPSLAWIGNIESLDGCLGTISQYTTRTLSYPTDILNAFAGVGNILSKQIETRFFFGLPERYLTQALLWFSPSLEVRRSGVPDVPSWSWAAWLSHVYFSPYLSVAKENNTGLLVKFHIQDSENDPQPLKVEETRFGGL